MPHLTTFSKEIRRADYVRQKYIAKKKNISENDAITKLYNSKLYATLEQEDTKVWQYSTDMLYLLFEQEEKTGKIEFPDV